MAQVKYNTCDRCGKEIVYGKFPRSKLTVIRYIKLLGFGPYDYVDGKNELCSDCSKDFDRWMEGTQNG